MHGFWLLIPFLLIRFLLLTALNREAVTRAAHFAPMQGKERIAYYVYQISNSIICLYLILCRVQVDFSWRFSLGLFLYVLGLYFCGMAVMSFSAPDGNGMNRSGVYKFSRNPMYMAYFICFTGMTLLVRSLILLAAVAVFQVSAHWIVLAEERWCVKQFGADYERYMREVRRYL